VKDWSKEVARILTSRGANCATRMEEAEPPHLRVSEYAITTLAKIGLPPWPSPLPERPALAARGSDGHSWVELVPWEMDWSFWFCAVVKGTIVDCTVQPTIAGKLPWWAQRFGADLGRVKWGWHLDGHRFAFSPLLAPAPPRRKPAGDERVYVIAEEDSDFCKVGWSDHPPRRLALLQTGNPHLLRLAGVYPGDCRDEAKLHQRLARWRVRGEWFRPVTVVLGEVHRYFAEKGVQPCPIP
jgi:hypothetical protein